MKTQLQLISSHDFSEYYVKHNHRMCCSWYIQLVKRYSQNICVICRQFDLFTLLVILYVHKKSSCVVTPQFGKTGQESYCSCSGIKRVVLNSCCIMLLKSNQLFSVCCIYQQNAKSNIYLPNHTQLFGFIEYCFVQQVFCMCVLLLFISLLLLFETRTHNIAQDSLQLIMSPSPRLTQVLGLEFLPPHPDLFTLLFFLKQCFLI